MVSVTFLLASLSPKFDRGTGECLHSNHILYPTPSEVKVRVHNSRELRNSSNVLGIIQGAVEPGEPVRTKPTLVCLPSAVPSLPLRLWSSFQIVM